VYCEHFAIAELPFSITPDPRYLYLGRRHAEALAHLVYGVSEAGGFIQLTGEVGTGKTTTVRSLLARAPQGVQIALILNPKLNPAELLQGLCEELGVTLPPGAGPKATVDALNGHLLAQHAAGRRVVLIVDEAQNLPVETLEQLRLLTNLETESRKLLQIILIGQPELRDLLARTELRQLAQRITARYHLEPLEAEDTEAYVRHRLRVAGAARELFMPSALGEVHRLSGGVPRLINVVCDRSLLAAYAAERTQVDAALVRSAAGEVFGRSVAPRWLAPVLAAAGIAVLAAGGALGWREYLLSQERARVAALRAAEASAAAAANAEAATRIVQPALAEQLAGADTSADAAFGQLFTLWGANYVPGTSDACTAARDQGLACVTLHSSIARLRELGRPAILMLGDATGGTRQVVLTALGEERVQLRAGTKQVEGKVSDLANAWFGECVLLWRTSANAPGELRVGMRSPLVPRLRKALAQWQALHPQAVTAGMATQGGADRATAATAGAGAASSVSYDEALKSLVQAFQRAHHLDDDGVAGIETQLMLDGVLAAPDSPRLGELKPGAA
jgi:general secretion pathway protein A